MFKGFEWVCLGLTIFRRDWNEFGLGFGSEGLGSGLDGCGWVWGGFRWGWVGLGGFVLGVWWVWGGFGLGWVLGGLEHVWGGFVGLGWFRRVLGGFVL